MVLKEILKKSKIIRYVGSELINLKENFIVKYPNTRLGMFMRKTYWSNRLNIGKNPKIHQGVILHANYKELIEIKDNVLFGPEVIVNAGPHGKVYIGKNTGIALRTFIRTDNHIFYKTDISFSEQGHECKNISFQNDNYSIVIEDDVWIGANCIILTGSHLAKGCVVSAGAVVSSIIPPYSIVVGNPARVVGNRLKKKGVK